MSLPLIRVDELLPLSLLRVQEIILTARRQNVGALTLRDLASQPDFPNGVYVFLHAHSPRPFYIGRSSGRSFIGRLPSHFEPYVEFWMNGLSKGMQSAGVVNSYQEGVNEALACDLVLIGFRYTAVKEDLLLRKQRINALEIVLQKFMQPILTSRKSAYSGTEVLSTLLPTNAG